MEKLLLSDLCLQLEEYILEQGYSKKGAIQHFKTVWKKLSDYMDRHGHLYYSPQVGQSFLDELHDSAEYKLLTRCQKEEVRPISLLTDYHLYGKIRLGAYHIRRGEFGGELGSTFREFINEVKTCHSESTTRAYQSSLYSFYLYLKEEGKTIKDIDTLFVIQYTKKIERERGVADLGYKTTAIRRFLSFLCKRQILKNNNEVMWNTLLKFKHISNPHIPSAYTKEEIEKVIASIDSSTPTAKRDFAILLLASRTGLRSSDICGLRFRNLLWAENKIALVQQKTGKKVSLPISEEVGCAIISYLKYERPQSDLPFVFLRACKGRYDQMGQGTLYNLVSKLIRRAGIDKKGRKSGPHSMRHSLAVNLFEEEVPSPVISEILGHTSSESTMSYTRVSVNMLRRCALDVPQVPSIFYEKLYE
jgi:site-specific recombinase XerD